MAFIRGARLGLEYRFSTEVVALSSGSVRMLAQSTHVATAPPQRVADCTQNELELPHVQPAGQRMHVSADKLVLPAEQAYPLSTMHAGLQPSPAAVPPSSHASAPARLPSPQPTGVAQKLAPLSTVYVLPGYAALHVVWLTAGLAGVAVE